MTGRPRPVGRAGAASGDEPDAGEVDASAFRGYNPIRYTPCPDEFFDRQMALMDDDELRVTLYAFRRTFGFKKTGDAISISQFLHGITTRDGRRLDHGCGLKTPRQVLAGLAKAEARRTLLSAFCCRACGGQVPAEAMAEEERRQRLVNGELRRYTVRVVPRLCPACGARLRGFEEKRYHLNVLESADDAGPASASRPAATPSVAATDPSPAPPPSVATTDPLCQPASGSSAHETDTRSRSQHTEKQAGQKAGGDDVGETTGRGVDAVAPVTPVFLPPGSRLPSPQLWAAAAAQAAPDLERADRDGWVRAAALLAAEAAPTGGPAVTLVLGVPTEHARRRCATRAGAALAGALALLLGRPVTLRPVVTSRWLAERGGGE
jgi:hypothetical protein